MSYTYTSGSAAPAFSPTDIRGSHGVVYTKPWAVDLVLDLAGYHSERDLGALIAVEPACGTGGFLAPMAARLAESCRRHGRDIATCAQALVAFELDPVSAEAARGAVAATLAAHGVAERVACDLARAWVRTGDFLLAAPALVPADVVVGNPPYVRLEAMDPATAEVYRRRYRTMVGRADLYVAFYEAALLGLKPGGVCAFVCADRWMLNQYGAELRRLVTSGFGVEAVVEMHRADAFEAEVSAYPAVTVIRRSPQGAAVVARVGAGAERFPKRALFEAIRDADGGTSASGLRGVTATRVDGWFEEAMPWPCSSPERLALLRHLEANFYPLESPATGTKVGIGVATGADDVFVTSNPEVVEGSRLLPLAMAADTRGGDLHWSGRYLVNPWDIRGLVELERYPRLAAYLHGHGERLRGRHVGKRSADAWFRTIDRVDHSLTARPKLYVADIKDRLTPVLDRGGTYPHHNLYWVASAVWDVEVLGGLLLSDVAQFFVECYAVRMRGGYLRFQAQYLRRIRVPRPHDLTDAQADGLRTAFRARDRGAATAVALACYGIDRIPPEVG